MKDQPLKTLPRLDGIDAAIEVSRERAVPFILVSGHHDAQTVSHVSAESVMGYLVKPVFEADLAVAIGIAMHRFRCLKAAEREVAELRDALLERELDRPGGGP